MKKENIHTFGLIGSLVFIGMLFNAIFTLFSAMTHDIQTVNQLGIFGDGTPLGYTLFAICWGVGGLGMGILSAENFRNSH